MSKHSSCVIIFAKAPIPGHVKTRLAADMDETIVLELYRHFGIDMVDKVTAADHDVKIFYDPPGSDTLMRDWLGRGHDFRLQHGADLGQKMTHAFQSVFESGYQRAVLMGTDFPDLPEKIISNALSGLIGHEAVIGPAADGGYYLIGFCADTFLPAVFTDKPWGTPAVFQKTMTDFEFYGSAVHQLPQWRDIDVYDDVIDLIQSLQKQPDQAKNTFSFLKKIKMIKQ